MNVKLGEWLRSKGKITEEQLQRALQDKAFFGERLGSSLIKLGFIDEDTLGAYLSEQSQTRYAPARRLEGVTPEVVAAVPARLAAKYCIVPIAIEGRRLHLAMRDPRDLIALDEIAFLTGLPIEPYVATEYRLVPAIERYYNISIATRTIPVSPGPPDPPRGKGPARGAAPVPAASRPARDPEIGLDGLPLGAEAADLDQPFASPVGQAPPSTLEPGEAPPRSLAAWRDEEDKRAETTAAPPGRGEAPGVHGTQPYPRAVPPLARATGAPPLPGTAGALVTVPQPAVTMEAVSARLRQSDTRDEVFDAVLEYSAAQCMRTALFVVQQDRVLGWSGRGGGLQPARVRNVIVPLDRPSLFIFLRSGGDYFYGPVPDLPANAKFFLDLGSPPPARVLLVPLTITDRPAVILYADNGPDASTPPDIQKYRRLLKKAAMALEVLILRNKIMMV